MAKYGYLGTMDSAWEPLLPTEATFQELWSKPMDEFLAAWKEIPPALFEDSPTDLDISHQMVPVRDGTKIELRMYRDKDTKPNAPLLLVAHGGGWVVGSHDIEEAMNRHVAKFTPALVVSVDYRMAPKFRFPYAVNDCFDILLWCKENASSLGIDPERIIVGGGSAGGNIASNFDTYTRAMSELTSTQSAVLAQMSRDKGISGVIGQVLNIPVTCHPDLFPKDKFEFTSWEQNKDAPVINEWRMRWFWDQYLPGKEREAYASPLLAKSFERLPPALVQVAGLDTLRDEGIAYAESMKSAGVQVTLKLYPGLPHGFYLFPQLQAAHDYMVNEVDWINTLLGPVSSNM